MTDPSPRLVLRADADGRIGTGHVMRGLALAQAWQAQGGEALFVGRISAGPLRQRLESEGFQVICLPAAYPAPQDLKFLLPWLHDHQSLAGWVVLDGYHFAPPYQQAIRAAGWSLVVMDDYAHLSAYHADILVNPNAYAGEMPYRNTDHALVLRGLRFAPLRDEFRQELLGQEDGDADRYCHPGRRILVSMGGADPDNATEKVVAALQAMDRKGLEVKIIVGPLNPYRQSLDERLRRAGLNAEIMTQVTAMVPLMRWADIAISAAGSTCSELAALGVPMVVTVLADNQERVATSLAEHGVAVNLGWHHAWQVEQAAGTVLSLLDDSQQRRTMGQRGQQLVDGRGCERLLQAMQGYGFSLRTATEGDCEVLFQWANEPYVRAVSFSREPITWQEHCRWFATRLADPDHIFYLAITPQGLPMAQARFSLSGDGEAVISVSVAREFRGLGLGPRLIRRACQQAMAEGPVTKIRALIRQDNSSSLQAFTQAGFRQHGTVEVSGQQSVAMDYTLEGVAA